MPEIGALSDGDDAGRTGRIRRAHDRAEISRVADLVQRDEDGVGRDRQISQPDRRGACDDGETDWVLAIRERCEGVGRDLNDMGTALGLVDEIESPLARQQLRAVEDDLNIGVLEGLPRGRDSLDQKNALRVPMLALTELARPLEERVLSLIHISEPTRLRRI